MTNPRLLTQEDAAAFLCLAPKTLARWRWAGRGPRFVKLGSAVRYSLDALERYVREGEVQP